MFFPNLGDIATREVVTISADSTVAMAAAKMAEHDLNIIVVHPDDDEYGLLTANDLIRLRLERVDFEVPIRTISYEIVPKAEEDTNLLDVLHLAVNNSGYICVHDEKGALTGIVSNSDIISSIDPKIIMEEQQVGQLPFNPDIRTADAGQPAMEVIADLLVAVGHAIVITEHAEPVGILTNKDAVRLFNAGEDLRAPVRTYMSAPLQTIRVTVSVKAALDFIAQRKFKRLVLVDDEDRLLGIISQQELVAMVHSKWAELMRKHEAELRELNKILEKRAEKLAKLAATDPMTGILNRARCEELLAAEINRCRRYRTLPFSLVLFDIDQFKKINDSFGHPVGDKVLKKIVDTVKVTVRSSDIFARWGGEEFVVLLPHTEYANALLAAEKLRVAVAAISTRGLPSVTCSFGVAQYSNPDDTAKTLFKRADQALYVAKRGGRNRVDGKLADAQRQE